MKPGSIFFLIVIRPVPQLYLAQFKLLSSIYASMNIIGQLATT